MSGECLAWHFIPLYWTLVRYECCRVRWGGEQDLISKKKRSSEPISTCQLLKIKAARSNEIHYVAWGNKKSLTKSMTQLTHHKDGERLIYWCIAVGGSKGVNPSFWRFQPHQPQLTDEPKRRHYIFGMNTFIDLYKLIVTAFLLML